MSLPVCNTDFCFFATSESGRKQLELLRHDILSVTESGVAHTTFTMLRRFWSGFVRDRFWSDLEELGVDPEEILCRGEILKVEQVMPAPECGGWQFIVREQDGGVPNPMWAHILQLPAFNKLHMCCRADAPETQLFINTDNSGRRFGVRYAAKSERGEFWFPDLDGLLAFLKTEYGIAVKTFSAAQKHWAKLMSERKDKGLGMYIAKYSTTLPPVEGVA